MKIKRHISKRLKALLIILAFLVGVRIALPGIVKTYLNNTLNEMDNYAGYVHDVDISLLRGAYVIDSITISKTNSSFGKPFFTANKIDISIEWRALFKGAIVGELYFNQPTLNFMSSKEEKETQYGKDEDWLELLKELLPVKINHLEINKGTIYFYDYLSDNQLNTIYLKNVHLNVTNISNVSHENAILPSSFALKGTSLGNGKLEINGKANFLKHIPDLDYDLTFENVDITKLNSFLKTYAGIDAESGLFFLYHELALNNNKVDGYVKPLLKNTKIFKWKNDNESMASLVWEPLVGVFKTIFENPNTQQIGSKAPLSGTITATDINVIKTIWNVFKNAFIDALENKTDNSIRIETG